MDRKRVNILEHKSRRMCEKYRQTGKWTASSARLIRTSSVEVHHVQAKCGGLCPGARDEGVSGLPKTHTMSKETR